MARSLRVIRAFKTSDAPHLLKIFCAAIDSLAAADYGPAARAVWRSRCPSLEHLTAAYRDGRQTFVAVGSQDDPLGFCDLGPDGHIQFLYVAPEAARQGIGTALLAALEACAKQGGLAGLTAEASQTALPVFQRAGFTCLTRRDFHIQGVAVHNYAVAKSLVSGQRSPPTSA